MSQESFPDVRLQLELVHPEGNLREERQALTPRQAQDFFGLGEAVTRRIVIHEALRILEAVVEEPAARYAIAKRLERRGSRVEVAAKLSHVRDGSLYIEIHVSIQDVLLMLVALAGV